jgi:hypothetical protein
MEGQKKRRKEGNLEWKEGGGGEREREREEEREKTKRERLALFSFSSLLYLCIYVLYTCSHRRGIPASFKCGVYRDKVGHAS